MSKEVEYTRATNRKGGAGAFESGRKLHVGIGVITLICSLALLLYIVSCMSGVLTSTSVDPALILMPALWLGACIAFAWGLSVYQSMTAPLRGNYMPRQIVKASGIAGAGCAIAMTVGLLTLVASGASTTAYRDFSIYFIIANIAMLVASWAGLYGATEIRDPEAPKETRTADEINAPMTIKVLFRRAFSYCGRHYGALIVLFFGLMVIPRILYVVVLSPWYMSLLGEKQFVEAWLLQNNIIAGVDISSDILNRYQLYYNGMQVFVYVQDVLKSAFYYATLGIGTTIILRSYMGEDSRLSAASRQARSRLGPLVVVSILFSLLYHLGLMLLFVPGLLIYAYCILAFPNLLFVGKYKTLQNFGEAKNRISGNALRSIMYVTVIYFMQFGFQMLLQFVIEGVVQGVGGMVVVGQWWLDPFGNLGSLLLLEILTGMLTTFLAPLEAAILAMMFFDLAARKRSKVVASMKSPSAKARVQSLSTSSLVDKTQKARYCPRCGLSVRKGVSRCPNCKAEVPLAES